MRIVFIHGIGEVGGAERELLTYVDQLPARGYEPIVICPDGGPLREELKVRRIRIFGAAFPPWRKLAGLWKRGPSIRVLRTLIDHVRPDLIHVNEFWWVPQTLRALSSLGTSIVPIVAHFRQDLPAQKARQYELGQVAHVCAVSQRVAATLHCAGVEAGRIHVIHSGVNEPWLARSNGQDRARVRRQLGIPDDEDEMVMTTVAHLFERKGYDIALKAFHQVSQAGLRAHYVIVGTGDTHYERRLRELCRRLGIDRRVHFMGFSDDVRAYLDASDLYVQPSLMEGFGISVLEAMARGKAVVASKTGGLPDMVVDGVTGRLVPPGDTEALVQAVRTLLENSERRREMGAAGRQRVMDHFSVERMMAKLIAVYDAAIRPRSGSTPVPIPS